MKKANSPEIIRNSETFFRIKLIVAVLKNRNLIYRNEMIVPAKYFSRIEAQSQITKEIDKRLRYSYFFISPDPQYDIIKYSDMARCNTYLKFSVLPNFSALVQKNLNH